MVIAPLHYAVYFCVVNCYWEYIDVNNLLAVDDIIGN